jgi:putative ABC transport system permease protein
MNLLKLSWKNVIHKPLSSSLSILLMMLGVGLVSFVILVSAQLEERFEKNVRGVDMVVGAKGSPLQLILSAVFQIDNPTGNMPLEEAEKLSRNRYVGSTIPLSYGDSYQGFRIVGTTQAYIDLYEAKLNSGELFEDEMEVVLGAGVAQRLSLTIGDTFESAHGLASEGQIHDEHPFIVKGILAPSNSVLDNLILTTTESIWHVHEHAGEEVPKEITALLVKFRSPMGVVQLPRRINQNSNLQAALPSFEINRLLSIMGVGISSLYYMALAIIIVSGLSVFISLFNTLKERQYELALLRAFGGSKQQLAGMILLEGLVITSVGLILGLLVSRGGILLLNGVLPGQTLQLDSLGFHSNEVILIAVTAGISVIAGLLPAIRVYRMKISEVLSEG